MTEYSDDTYYYASKAAEEFVIKPVDPVIPKNGMPARYVTRIIEDYHLLDSSERLNTSSYVNVVFEKEETEAAVMGMKINLADQTVYPSSFKIHDQVINMIANLWHAPKIPGFTEDDVHPGAGTVGSTEACLLAGLALKFRWRKWYAKRNNLTEAQVRREYPNIIISDLYQACWEKFFKYFDVQPLFVKSSYKTCITDPAFLKDLVNDHTIGVVGIMGNHYTGHYDPIASMNEAIEEINKENGFQVGIHVDAASGGFIAPFQQDIPPWDFRLNNVLSISASGHKFGESVCGTGWVIWRQREDLSEHVAISVTYLGGKADSYTLNFSRPASGVFVQFYKFLRLGMTGYERKVASQMANSKYIRDNLRAMTKDGKPRFIILDDCDEFRLPVVSAMLNPELGLGYDDIDLQHAIAEEHWYVSGYRMSFLNPENEQMERLFSDMKDSQSMFRVVVKSNLTRTMARNLLAVTQNALEFLDKTYKASKKTKSYGHAHC